MADSSRRVAGKDVSASDGDVLIIGRAAGSVIACGCQRIRIWYRADRGWSRHADPADTPFDLINSHNNSYTDHDWGFAYQPTQHRSDRFPRGRVVGGSSAVNTTIALRGMPEDYDEWAEVSSDHWSWRNVLPAFKRLERDLDFPDAPYHGDSGPITIRRYPPAELVPQQQAFLDSALEPDYPTARMRMIPMVMVPGHIP